MAKAIKLEEAIKQATYVSTDDDLKAAVQRGIWLSFQLKVNCTQKC